MRNQWTSLVRSRSGTVASRRARLFPMCMSWSRRTSARSAPATPMRRAATQSRPRAIAPRLAGGPQKCPLADIESAPLFVLPRPRVEWFCSVPPRTCRQYFSSSSVCHACRLRTATSGGSSMAPKPCSCSHRICCQASPSPRAADDVAVDVHPVRSCDVVEVLWMSEREGGEVMQRVAQGCF